MSSTQFKAMTVENPKHLIDRAYREGCDLLWAREVLTNALEASSTRVQFDVEWQAVKTKGVYRRVIADNGNGMNFEEIEGFFNTFGGGGKPIGGVHENFGIGSKTALCPWNPYGIVVVSWKEGIGSMIWVQQDQQTGQYGLKLFPCTDDEGNDHIEAVVEPHNDPEHGCDWREVRPKWLGDHGTVIVLMGESPESDTVLGDPQREEGGVCAISRFLNTRLYEVSPEVTVVVREFHSSDKKKWPTKPQQSQQAETAALCLPRKIEGAKHFITSPSSRSQKGTLANEGIVKLKDGTEVWWAMWKGERPQMSSHAAETGYIAALYKNELYSRTSHLSTYKAFGVTSKSLQRRLWLIVSPQVSADGTEGVYPRSDRNALLLRNGNRAGREIPLHDWGREFADNMPDAIVDAIRAERTGQTGQLEDPKWLERLAALFGNRWKISRPSAKQKTDASAGVEGLRFRRARRPNDKSEKQGRAGTSSTTKTHRTSATPAGTCSSGRAVNVSVDVPSFRTAPARDFSPGIMATYVPTEPDFPAGLIKLNAAHPVIEGVIKHWQNAYASHHADEIEKDVIAVYGMIAATKVAHSEQMRGHLSKHDIEEGMRSDLALTMALMGLMAEDAVLATRVGGKYGKKKG